MTNETSNFLFFFPDFVVWLITIGIVLLMALKKKRQAKERKKVNLGKEEKYMCLFFFVTFILVVSEAIVASFEARISYSTFYINVVGIILMFGFFILSLVCFANIRNKKGLIPIIASLVMFISFMTSAISIYNLISLNVGFSTFVTYVFPGVCFLDTHDRGSGGPIIGPLLSREFVFFLPNFTVFILLVTIILTLLFISKKNKEKAIENALTEKKE